MKSCRPLLGTYVEVRVFDGDEQSAARAIESAFRAVTKVQQLMSVHRADSDVRRINREDGITVISNLHLLQTARDYCDRIIGMRKGAIVFDGAPAELSESLAREIYSAGNAGGENEEEVELALTATSAPGS